MATAAGRQGPVSDAFLGGTAAPGLLEHAMAEAPLLSCAAPLYLLISLAAWASWQHAGSLVVACELLLEFTCGIPFLDQGSNPGPPPLGAWNLSYWTARQSQALFLHGLPVTRQLCSRPLPEFPCSLHPVLGSQTLLAVWIPSQCTF